MLNSSKLKEFAENYYKFDQDGRRFSNGVENTVGIGEIARYQAAISPFPTVFSKDLYCRHVQTIKAFWGKGLNNIINYLKHPDAHLTLSRGKRPIRPKQSNPLPYNDDF